MAPVEAQARIEQGRQTGRRDVSRGPEPSRPGTLRITPYRRPAIRHVGESGEPNVTTLAAPDLQRTSHLLSEMAVGILLKKAPVAEDTTINTLVASALERDGLAASAKDQITSIVISTSTAAVAQPFEVIEESARTFDRADQTSDLLRQHASMKALASSPTVAETTRRPTTTRDYVHDEEVPEEVLRREVAERAVEHQVIKLFEGLNGTGPADQYKPGIIHTATELTRHIVGELSQSARYETIAHTQATSQENASVMPSLEAQRIEPAVPVAIFVPKSERTQVTPEGKVVYINVPRTVNRQGQDTLRRTGHPRE